MFYLFEKTGKTGKEFDFVATVYGGSPSVGDILSVPSVEDESVMGDFSEGKFRVDNVFHFPNSRMCVCSTRI